MRNAALSNKGLLLMKNPSKEAGYYIKGTDGTFLVLDQYKGIIGRPICEATARAIVDSHPDREDLIKFITDMLIGIEYIKMNERDLKSGCQNPTY